MENYECQVFGVNSYENLAKEIYKKDMKHYHNSINNSLFPLNPDNNESVIPKTQIQIVGNLITKQYVVCCEVAMRLYRYRKRLFKKPIIIGLVQMDWTPYRYHLNWKLPEVYMGHTHVAVSIDNREIGDETEFMKWVYKRFRVHFNKNFRAQGLRNLIGFFDAHSHLYNDICPETCRNFLRLCREKENGLEGTPIHRVVPECWFQGGGYVLPKNKELIMENYIISHNRRGVLSMACCCHGIANSTQFFVTFGDQTWMNQRYVAFGQLIYGESILKRIEAVPTLHDAPKHHILIVRVTIYKEEPEIEELQKQISEYLKGHIEDVIELAHVLIDEIFLAFEVEIENKYYLAYGETEMEGGEFLSPNPRSVHTMAPGSRNGCQHMVSQSPMSSPHEELRPKREFYLPFSNVCCEHDSRLTMHDQMPMRAPRVLTKSHNKEYRKRAEKIMSEWLACKTTLRVIRGRREKDTPLQKLMKKKTLPDRGKPPTINDSIEKKTNEAYFTLSCNFHFSHSEDSSFERIEKRKHVLNDAGFSKMATIYDKSSVHRRVSYSYFTAQASKMNLSTELIKLSSLRVANYASKRPCMPVETYKEMNKAKRDEEALRQQEELEEQSKNLRSRKSTKSILLKEGCECCLLPKKICSCDQRDGPIVDT